MQLRFGFVSISIYLLKSFLQKLLHYGKNYEQSSGKKDAQRPTY